jgi:Icc-related predicted phosphoesterase
MKIQYCSDLHLEFTENVEYLHSNSICPAADILILAGDIIPFRKELANERYFDFLSKAFKEVYWLPGNHEYYNCDILHHNSSGKKRVRDNIYIVNDQFVSIDGIDFIFTTLWSKISPPKEAIITRSLSDFYQIKVGNDFLYPSFYNSLHQQSIHFLESSLQLANSNKCVVISHHVPTLLNYPSKYLNSPINEAFAVELTDIIEKYQPDAWIYGHSHVNTPEFSIGRTKMLTNQLGYVHLNEHSTFKPKSVISI